MLLDDCVDAQVAAELARHEVYTVRQEGWRGKKHGELLRLAAARFDVLVTADSGIEFQ